MSQQVSSAISSARQGQQQVDQSLRNLSAEEVRFNALLKRMEALASQFREKCDALQHNQSQDSLNAALKKLSEGEALSEEKINELSEMLFVLLGTIETVSNVQAFKNMGKLIQDQNEQILKLEARVGQLKGGLSIVEQSTPKLERVTTKEKQTNIHLRRASELKLSSLPMGIPQERK